MADEIQGVIWRMEVELLDVAVDSVDKCGRGCGNYVWVAVGLGKGEGHALAVGSGQSELRQVLNLIVCQLRCPLDARDPNFFRRSHGPVVAPVVRGVYRLCCYHKASRVFSRVEKQLDWCYQEPTSATDDTMCHTLKVSFF